MYLNVEVNTGGWQLLLKDEVDGYDQFFVLHAVGGVPQASFGERS